MSSKIFSDVTKNRLYMYLGFVKDNDVVDKLLEKFKKEVKLLDPDFTVLFDMSNFSFGEDVDLSRIEEFGRVLCDAKVGVIARISKGNYAKNIINKFTGHLGYKAQRFSSEEDARGALDNYRRYKK